MTRRHLTMMGAILLTACSSGGTATTTAPPAIAAYLGQPKTVTQADGSTATITLNTVHYAANGDASTELAIVDLTITGNSVAPFTYSESHVVFGYPDDGASWSNTQDTHTYGPNPTEDYTPYLPPAPLRAGSLTKGKTVRGLVILSMSLKSPYLLFFTDMRDGSRVAEWQATST